MEVSGQSPVNHAERAWEAHPRGGWDEFQTARRRLFARLAAQSREYRHCLDAGVEGGRDGRGAVRAGAGR